MVFSQANLCAEHWLGQVKTFGRPPEIEFFGDRHKGACMTEFHSEAMPIVITYRFDRNKVISVRPPVGEQSETLRLHITFCRDARNMITFDNTVV